LIHEILLIDLKFVSTLKDYHPQQKGLNINFEVEVWISKLI